MKRLHVHLAVENLAESIRFYAELFAAAPTVAKDDYAKWMLDDPRVNFAISQRGAKIGLQHLGIQVETPEELDEAYGRLKRVGRAVVAEGAAVCCYAQSEKSWVTDPQGLWWETFLTTGESTVYGGDPVLDASEGRDGACCAPQTPQDAGRQPRPDRDAKTSCCG
jgi:hypothetical protein